MSDKLPNPFQKKKMKINFLEPGAFQTSGFAKIDGPVTLSLYDLKC